MVKLLKSAAFFFVFALTYTSVGPSIARANIDPFLIHPYVFSILGKQIGVAWQYTPGIQVPMERGALFFRAGSAPEMLPVSSDQGLEFVVLPVPPCGYSKIAYQIFGMIVPQSVAEIPCSTSRDAVRFSFLADSQEGPEHATVFAKQMRIFPASAILHGGDIVQTGDEYEDWVRYFEAMRTIGASRVLYPTVGNHEYRGAPGVPLWKHFFRTEARDSHYAFDLGAARVIAINSNFEDDPDQRGEQIDWLRAQLAMPARWKIVYFHHPAFSIGIANAAHAPKKEHLFIQDYMIPLFERYGVDLVLNGHVHLFEASVKNGIHYLTVGPSGGRMGLTGGKNPYLLKSGHERTVVHLEAAPDHLRAMSVDIHGKVLDDLILRKP